MIRARLIPARWTAAAALLVGGAGVAASDDAGKPAPVVAPAGAVKPTPVTKPALDPLADAYAAADAVDDALVKAVASVQPSSVTVRNLRKVPDAAKDGPAFVMASGGSGVIISWKGQGPYVITNEHVVHGADRLEIVAADGAGYEMHLRDHVARYDIALLEFVREKPKAWKAAKFGKSEALKEGQWVIATGNPFFLALDGRSVATFGVVSGLDRTLRGDFTYANAIQHDAEVNPGNSGGPLWNIAGELIGINGMISSRGGGSSLAPSNTGASFAIPIHLIAGYLDTLVSDKVEAAAGYLGLDLSDEKDKAGKPVGARVNTVQRDSPLLGKGGRGTALVVGDVVTRFWLGPTAFSMKPYDVYCASDATNALAFYASGAKCKIRFQRNGKELTWEGDLTGAAVR